MTRFRNVMFAAVFLVTSSLALATQTHHNGNIEKILLDGERYGGCMVYLNPNLPSNLNCRLDFVSLDCNGDLVNTKTHAKAMLDMAQLAFLVEKSVRIRVSDEQTINGFCTADYLRIDK
jgi:hypothetical protein